MEVYFMV